MTVLLSSTSRFARFTHKEDGAMTAFGLILTIAMLGVGGLGLDYANGIMVKTHLQIAADSAAHAAIMAREFSTPNDSKNVALAVAQRALPVSKFGDTITADDIEFGYWDAATRSFTPDPLADEAVRVNTARLEARSNGVSTSLLRFVGVDNLDVVSQSIFETYYPTCFREGFVAENRIDVQSNNTYGNGFCIHSNQHVEINNGNTFMEGTIVSMPDKRDLVIPSSDTSSNPGIDDALRSGSYRLRVLDQINQIIAGVEDPDSPYYRTDYVSIDAISGTPPTVPLSVKKNFSITDWVPGAIHTLNCSSKNAINFGSNGDVFEKGILITNCVIKFGAGVALEDIVMVNTSTELDSFQSAAMFTLGRDDGCADGGGAQLVTLGGVSFTSQFHAFGSQILAQKRVTFTAQSDSIEGISIVSGDQIDANSLINVGFCGGSGMDNNFMAEYFRLAS